MALATYLRLYWSGNNSINIVSANSTTDVFVVAGDKSRNFIAGTPFTGTGTHTGSYTSLGATYSAATGNTTISVAAVGSTTGATGTLVEHARFIEFEWAKLLVTWSNPGVTKRDRLGIAHRIRPTGSTSKQRFAIGAILRPSTFDALIKSNDGRTLPEVIYDEAIELDTQFTIFHYEVNYQGGDVTTKRAYRGYLEVQDNFELLGSLSHDGSDPAIELVFTITGDGEFTQLGDLTSYSARTRP